MARERMLGYLSGLVMAMILAFIFFCAATLPETAFSQGEGVQEQTDYPSSVDPYEVIVYEHYDFVGRYMRFKLLPAMRQLLVPDLPTDMNDRISSIQVGSKVGVFVFIGSNFRGGFPWNIIRQSKGKLSPNDKIRSLIVFPIEWGAPLGVMLRDLHEGDVIQNLYFYPLPQDANKIEEKYYALGGMDDNANQIQLFPFTESPVYGKVQVTLYEHPSFMGRWITLPGADGSIPAKGLIRMNTFQFDDIASSLIVRWTGPPPPQLVQIMPPNLPPPPSTKAHVSAPRAPDTTQDTSGRTPPPPGSETAKAPPDKTPPLPPDATVIATDISGQWNSNIGAVYEIQQSGTTFTWSVPSLNQSGTGTISGTSVTMSGPGWTVKGKITETAASGRPTKIVGENGVILFRTT
jgi:hypothetical protein